jgi:hypothetical protein
MVLVAVAWRDNREYWHQPEQFQIAESGAITQLPVVAANSADQQVRCLL